MRIRRLAVPIAITSALVVLGGVTAGLIWAWSPAPSSVQSNLQAANLPVEPPAAAEPMSMTWSSAPSESEVKHSARVDSAELGGSDVNGPATASDDTLPTLPEKPELKYPNLGSNLDQLVASVEEGETSAKEAAEDAPVHQEASVAVTIYLSGNLDDVVKFLEDNGGSPRNVGEDYIEAYVPVTLLGQVSERPGVIRVREIAPAEPAQSAQRVAGHGPPVHGSSAWNQAGFGGQGVKVGVIDSNFGFNDFSGLMGTELPSTVQARCYTSLGKFTRFLASCENSILGSNHGTLVAEALIDIAPEVSLYIATPRSLGDLQTTTDWMVSQGVSVIVHSITHEYDGPGDGTSPFSNSPLRAIDRAVAGGSVWVNSAGNAGQRTWFGAYSNSDGDSYIDFNGFDEGIDIQLKAGDEITVQLRWEDSWSGATSDFDLFVYDHPTKVVVASSFDPQGGAAGHIPYESVNYIASHDGPYFVSVLHYSGSTPRWIQLAVWAVDPIQHHTGSGSITNPAESANPGMLAVGAAPWYDVNTIEPYSSRGPTPDGRVKPDIVGADCGATALRPLDEYGDGFCGTSQAAPHVAGMAAMVRQRFPTYTTVEVANYLKEHTEQRESPDPNNTWGHGFAKLPSLSECSDAVPSVASNPGLVADCEALLAARDTLAGSGTLNWSGSTAIAAWDGVTLSGSPLQVTSLVLSDSQLTGTIPPELGNLNNLERLNLTRNQLTGDIPPELSLLTNVQLLALGGNQLTGPIPTWLVNITNLEELYLWGNQFTGAIPPELGNLPGLVKLGLGENQLTGTIPPELGNLNNLERLNLTRNQLTGDIPPELSLLTNVQLLALGGNQLTGPIPTWLVNITNLEELYLWGNQFTGAIPPELGNLPGLVKLGLGENRLTGEIPTELGSLAKLERLSLSDNQLSGSIPTELGSLANLTILSLWGNELTGEIPTELGSLAKLERLSLSDNQLTGGIPTELGSLANLTILSLWGNELTGEIPAGLGSLTNLVHLVLSGNQLTGCIPSGLRGIETNDLSLLGLQFCDMPGAPTIATQIVPGDASLTVAWAAPINTGSSAITAYDLRYIETGAADKSDANWTVVEDVWAAGSGSLQYTLSGLTGGTQYDVQVRAVNAAGASAWSATVTGTTTSAVVGTAPVFSDSEGNPITEAVRSVVENTAAGENVGAPVTAMDADNDTLTYSLGGTDMASFDIDPSTGQIMVGAGTMLDYETKASYMVTVTATDPDSASDMITVPITVTNEEETGEVTLWAGMDALTMAPQVGDTITGAVMDPDGGVTGETWQWSRTMDDMDSRDMDSWVDIEDATDDEYTVMEGDTGYYLRVMATYMDAVGTDTAMEYSMPTIMVTAEDLGTLGSRYDTDNNRLIDKEEAIAAVRDYFDDRLTKEETIEIIRLYFTSSS